MSIFEQLQKYQMRQDLISAPFTSMKLRLIDFSSVSFHLFASSVNPILVIFFQNETLEVIQNRCYSFRPSWNKMNANQHSTSCEGKIRNATIVASFDRYFFIPSGKFSSIPLLHKDQPSFLT